MADLKIWCKKQKIDAAEWVGQQIEEKHILMESGLLALLGFGRSLNSGSSFHFLFFSFLFSFLLSSHSHLIHLWKLLKRRAINWCSIIFLMIIKIWARGEQLHSSQTYQSPISFLVLAPLHLLLHLLLQLLFLLLLLILQLLLILFIAFHSL